MRVLVACEYSGIVRDAFIRRGFDAISCDIIPTESPGPHYLGDVRNILGDGWDMMIAHPPCTYLANSGVSWLHRKPGRWDLMRDGAEFFKSLLHAPIEYIAIENPVMHKYAVDIIGRRQDQCIQPWQFGHPETKRICLWLKNLPPLIETYNVKHIMDKLPDNERQRIHWMPPGSERGKERSRFYTGIADAMAEQWGNCLLTCNQNML